MLLREVDDEPEEEDKLDEDINEVTDPAEDEVAAAGGKVAVVVVDIDVEVAAIEDEDAALNGGLAVVSGAVAAVEVAAIEDEVAAVDAGLFVVRVDFAAVEVFVDGFATDGGFLMADDAVAAAVFAVEVDGSNAFLTAC